MIIIMMMVMVVMVIFKLILITYSCHTLVPGQSKRHQRGLGQVQLVRGTFQCFLSYFFMHIVMLAGWLREYFPLSLEIGRGPASP